MSILEKYIKVNCGQHTDSYYESLGYKIPKYIDKKGRKRVKKGTTITVKVIDLSRSSAMKVTKICDICSKKIPNQAYNNIINYRNLGDGKDRCKQCSCKKGGLTRKRNITYDRSLEHFAKENNKEYLLNEYCYDNKNEAKSMFYGSNEVCLWDCYKCGSNYEMKITDRTILNYQCPYCHGSRVNHTNCLWTTHPEIAGLLINSERGYQITHGSNSEEDFKCLDCGYIKKNKKVYQIIRDNGVSCPRCSDGISYPEKFMANILSQLEINFETQKKFDWSDNRKYDFYIPLLNCIIETHGGQHYKQSTRGRSLIKEQENDRTKELLAKKNGVKNYNVIDCSYSELNWIKQNVINSTLSSLMDLTNIDWFRCHNNACSSLVKTTCELWNSGLRNTTKICEVMKLSRSAVTKYLKQGALLGWCNYDASKVSREIIELNKLKNNKKCIQFNKNGDFLKEWDSIGIAAMSVGISATSISLVCRRKGITAGGYKWMYSEEYKNMGLCFKKTVMGCEIVQLSSNGELIKHWDSMSEASKSLDISVSCISSVCRRKQKSAGGFGWMYKEVYKKSGQ
ncbi:zinc-ribbon domain-containing protein [Niallia alba]|uniref:zinc-ribbon domain-containing protein n=1 Tax=Niallia alba TaxID=2729105 RepID=UPI002E2118D5|nr:zinc-ribbon domain-containing protein [Niallia alba]